MERVFLAKGGSAATGSEGRSVALNRSIKVLTSLRRIRRHADTSCTQYQVSTNAAQYQFVGCRRGRSCVCGAGVAAAQGSTGIVWSEPRRTLSLFSR